MDATIAFQMPVLDFQHLKHRLAWAFPDDPILGQPDPASCPPPMPFVVGVPRSGTTLLRLMLDAHPDVAIPAETGFLLTIVNRPPSAGPLSPLELHRLVTHAPNWQDVALGEQAYLEALTSLHPYSVSDGLRAFYRLYAGKFGKPRWGEKTPSNLERLQAIAHILPEAHFIHIVRDGRDVALSLREMWFAPGRDMTTLARFWSERIRQARREAERNLRYLEIRYEDLIADPERSLRDVCAFVDLAFDPRMLRYHETARQRLDEVQTWVRPDGSAIVTKEQRLYNQRFTSLPPTADRVGRWRRAMASEERAEFESVAGDLLEELGYR
jgi:hypothetical protein